jgi:hypothetical protein
MQTAIGRVTSSPFGVGDAKHNYSREAGPAETVFPGMWPREVLERVGAFDPELQRNQDDELSFRIREAGGTIWYDPAIEVAYEQRGSLARLFQQYREYGMWKVRVFQIHPRALRPRQLVPPAWIGAIAGGLALGLLTPIGWFVAAAAAGSYLAVMLVASRRLAGPGTTPALILASLLTLHSAYGIGMWQGVIRFAPRWVTRRRGQPARLEPRPDSDSP